MKIVSALLAAVIVFAICYAGQMFNADLPAVLPAVLVGVGVYAIA